MLLSRFWYLILALALGAAVGGLFLAQTVYNRASTESMEQALWADTQVVKWYINDDARRRSSLLLKVCLDGTIRKELSKASSKDEKVPQDVKDRTRAALKKLMDEMPSEYQFNSLFAIDQLGRVIGQVGFDQAAGIENFDMGGYAIVADALHGWVRDDAWVLDDRIYLVVARPVEVDTAKMPAGAVVGLRIIDTSYAKQLSKRSGAAVGFFAGSNVTAKAAPEGVDATQLDTIVADIKNLKNDETYQEKGKTKPKVLMGDIGVIYSKIPGEAWTLGA
ncbi:MAG: CHASE4 domain-containing protein, partial [Myxococcota bacterium]